MTDLSGTIEPKSDQLNADDLIAGPKTLVITAVKVVAGDQPVSISYDGDNGKPWKPCKSMCRVLIYAWGKDGDKYIGRTVKVFLDQNVKWAGTAVGGIRISHMSHIEKQIRMMLTEAPAPLNALTDEQFEAFKADFEKAESMADLSIIVKAVKAGNFDAAGSTKLRAQHATAKDRVRG